MPITPKPVLKKALVTLELQQQPVLYQSLDLERRIKFWRDRAISCQDYPDMVAACTKRHANKDDPETQREFKEANESFRDGVLGIIWQFLGDLPEQPKTGLELFVGPGIFFRKLVDRVPSLYGVDLIEENLAHTQQYTDPGHLLCRPAHCIEDEVGGEYGYPKGFNKEDFDIIFAFRGFVHQPPRERIQTLRSCINLLKPGGHLVIGEMFEDDRPSGRKVNQGTWYWKIKRYEAAFGKKMSLIHLSELIDNDGDPCRVAIARKN